MASVLDNNQPLIIEPFLTGSCIIRNFALQCGIDPASAYESILNDAHWIDRSENIAKYRGRPLARDKSYYVITTSDGSKPQYSFPGFQHAQVGRYQPFEALPIIHQIAGHLRELTINGQPFNVNHIIATRYKDGNDNISYHSDKPKSFVPNTPIVSLSFGERREMHIGLPNAKDKRKTDFVQAFILNPGDAAIISWNDNLTHRHAIVKAKEETLIERDAQYVLQPRISLVARHIGAVVKQKRARAPALNADADEAEDAGDAEDSVVKRHKNDVE